MPKITTNTNFSYKRPSSKAPSPLPPLGTLGPLLAASRPTLISAWNWGRQHSGRVSVAVASSTEAIASALSGELIIPNPPSSLDQMFSPGEPLENNTGAPLENNVGEQVSNEKKQ